MTLQSTETIDNITELQESGKLTSFVRTGLVPASKLKAWQIWWDVKYEMEINKVGKTEAVKRVAAIQDPPIDKSDVFRYLRMLK